MMADDVAGLYQTINRRKKADAIIDHVWERLPPKAKRLGLHRF